MKIIHRFTQNEFNLPDWPLDPVLTKIFYSRGIKSTSELIYSINNLLPPTFLQIDNAADRIAEAIINNQKIRIVGDYDTDGATSTALAMRFFKDIGYDLVDFYIPKRQIEGYGISPNIVTSAYHDNVDLIITVDNGITAFEAAQYAKEIGIDLIITDHHLPLAQLPTAYAIVNPMQKDCDFASKNISGCGVIFYVVACVRKALRLKNYFTTHQKAEPIIANYLDLVAVGTIADVVPLDYNNRLLVQLGLEHIRKNNTTQGVMQLIKTAGCKVANLTAVDICFGIGPRLNAAGRIEDMSFGVQCLMATDSYQARVSASLLETFNNRRKQLELNMKDLAYKIITEKYASVSKGIVVFAEEFHNGIVGILAGKLADDLNVPVVVFARNQATGLLIGSARSVGDFHIKECFERISKQLPLEAFGGHSKAAGVTIKDDKLAQFKELFFKEVDDYFHGSFPEKTYTTDGSLHYGYFFFFFVRAVVFDHPWGTDFPEPLFDGVFAIKRQFIFKNTHMRVLLVLPNNQEIWGMYYYFDKNLWPNRYIAKVRIVYNFASTSNRNDAPYSLIIRAMEPCA